MAASPIYVYEHQTIVDVFRKIREADLSGLPIVDAEMKVICYLDLLELVPVGMGLYLLFRREHSRS